MEPIREEVSHGEYQETHPSYGMVRFSRVQGGHQNLYGSSISHQNYIELTVYRGRRVRHLSTDWYHADAELLSLKLSSNQFAELISNMNCGSGVPCTLEWVVGERMPECPERHRRQEVQDELSADLKRLGSIASELERKLAEMAKPGAVKKSDINELQELARKAVQEIRSNVPFAHEQFNKACDRTVMEAKAEIDAAFTGLIARMGIEALHERVSELIGMSEAPKTLTLEHKPSSGQTDNPELHPASVQ